MRHKNIGICVNDSESRGKACNESEGKKSIDEGRTVHCSRAGASRPLLAKSPSSIFNPGCFLFDVPRSRGGGHVLSRDRTLAPGGLVRYEPKYEMAYQRRVVMWRAGLEALEPWKPGPHKPEPGPALLRAWWGPGPGS